MRRSYPRRDGAATSSPTTPLPRRGGQQDSVATREVRAPTIGRFERQHPFQTRELVIGQRDGRLEERRREATTPRGSYQERGPGVVHRCCVRRQELRQRSVSQLGQP